MFGSCANQQCGDEGGPFEAYARPDEGRIAVCRGRLADALRDLVKEAGLTLCADGLMHLVFPGDRLHVTLSPLFQEFVDDAGPLETYARPASPDALQGLPRTFVDLVEEVGFASYPDGLVRLVDPGRYRSVLGMFLRDDPDFSPEHCHVIAVGAFGTLVGWSEKHGSFGIDPP